MPGPNMLYISGMHTHASERPLVLLVPQIGDPAVIIPLLEAPKATAADIPENRIFAWGDGEGYMGAFQQACRQLNLAGQTIAVEKLYMRILEWDMLEEFAPGLQKEYADPIFNQQRLVKDAQELANMQKAVDVAEKAMHALLPKIKIGMNELEIAALLRQELLDAGSDRIAFGPIVSSGPNAASPHAVPTDRPIAAGELLIIDWGATINDYPSDITRTFAVGAVTEEQRHMYETVRRASAAGVAAINPDATCSDIDKITRGVVDEGGLAEYFIHRTGHGLGLELHEEPSIMTGVDQPLVPGMTFTVEPGVYIRNQGGVRIEENVVVTEEGCRLLTSFPRELIEVG